MQEENVKKTSWWDIIKRSFFVLIMVQMLPGIFIAVKTGIDSAMNPKPQVGVVDLRGEIHNSNRCIKEIRSFAKQNEIKAILLRVNSPGGVPGASELVFRELERAKLKKPVVTLVESVCASGAYYAAAASDYIVAPATSVVGSVGVLSLMPNVKGLADDWKVNVQTVQSGKFKTVGNPFGEPLTSEERLYRQEVSDSIYDQFYMDVAKSRGLDFKMASEWANGKVFTGRDALKLGLIDKIGGMSDVEDEIKKRANISGDINFVRTPKPSFLAKLSGADDEAGSEISASISSILAEAFFKISTGAGLSYKL
jgi:protease IV